MSDIVSKQKNNGKKGLPGEIRQTLETVTDLLRLQEESDHTVLICGEDSLSYRQLAADAKKIARGLIRQGLRKGDRILLSVQNSIHVVRAMYGILLAGGVYVAADMRWPSERLRLVSEEAGVSWCITDEMILELLRSDLPETALPVVREEDEAAVYYTSGSTGTPKGTVLHHRILVSFAKTPDILPEFYDLDCIFTIPVFAAVFPAVAVFTIPAYENTLVFPTPQEMTSIEQMVDCLVRNRVQCLGATPSFLLRTLLHPLFARVIRQQVTNLWVGGEMLKESDAVRLLSAMENGVLVNGYGSTETFLFSTSRYEPGKEIYLEGFPEGVKVYLLDRNLKTVSAGDAGEILVGGISSQYGHYLDPELNQKKYLDHPVYGRLFRIGDAGRLREDGTIRVIGRIDRMIKLHGLRIEPGEVEAAMELFEGIHRAAVSLKKEQLCGYYTAEKEVEERVLREFLSEHLPYYMIPSMIMHMDVFPINENGKLDYLSLPEPELGAASGSAPATEREGMLCRIFGEVLDTETPPGAEDSFFSLGGDSIHALMAASLLEKEGFSLELTDIFTAPTPRLLAPRLRALIKSEEQSEDNKEEDAAYFGEGTEIVYPVTRHVESRFRRRGSLYPIVLTGEIDASASKEQLRQRITELSEKHDALRSRIMTGKDGEPVQVVQNQTMTEFFYVDLRKLSKGDGLSEGQRRYLSSLVRMELSERTELGGKTTFRLGYIRISDKKAILFCGFSHYLLDGIGIAVILREVLGHDPVLQDRTLWQKRIRRLFGEDRSTALAYWNIFFEQAGEAVPFPAAACPGPKKSFFMAGGRKRFETLKKCCAEKGSTLSILMTYAIGRALLTVQGTENALFYTMGTGRNASEMQLPGMFTVSFPVYLKQEDSLEDLQRQLIRSERYAWVFGLPDVPLPSGEELLNLNVQNIPVPEGYRSLLPNELEDEENPAGSLWNTYFAVTDTPLEIQAYPDERFGFMGWCDTSRYDAAALERLMREALKELRQFLTDNK